MWIVEDLENSIDIVELVWRYTKLKKSGANYKSVCPFPGHNEKTPSFVVSPTKQLGYCFWCHKWGWPLKFIMDIENVEFKEAIEILWWITWIETWNATKNFKDFKNIYTIMRDISAYYEWKLNDYPEMQKYLYDRWITKEDFKTYKIWFSDSGIELYKYLKDKKYDDDLISETNVFVDFKSKKDKFINRIIFALQNIRWDIIWFAWRVVDPIQNPKYLNSPASEIYDKSQTLYWLYNAKSEIVNRDFVIVCEWYMDVIALQKAWILNSVWVSWTALTDKHIPIIKRLTKKIYLCFDSDEAWKKATMSSIELLKNNDLEVKIINMKDFWKDPDEVLKSWINFEDLITNALSPIWFYLEKVLKDYDLNSIEDKKKLLKELLEILKSYNDIIEKDFYLREISKKLDVSIEILYESFNKTRIKKNTSKDSKNKTFLASEILIWIALNDISKIPIIKEKLIFPEYIDGNLSLILNWKYKEEDVEQEILNKYKWISIKIEEKISEMWEETFYKEISNLCHKLNSENYQKIYSDLKYKMSENPDDLDLLMDYQNILKKAKENGLK